MNEKQNTQPTNPSSGQGFTSGATENPDPVEPTQKLAGGLSEDWTALVVGLLVLVVGLLVTWSSRPQGLDDLQNLPGD